MNQIVEFYLEQIAVHTKNDISILDKVVNVLYLYSLLF